MQHPSGSEMFGASIVIPTYNRAPFLGPTLDSLRLLRVPPGCPVELLVIDNNCTDGTAEIVAAAARGFPFSLRHVVETNQGLCHGRNRGIREARHEWLVYLDDDIVVNADWLLGLEESVRRHAADAVVGPVFPRFLEDKPHYLAGRALESISSGYSRKGDAVLVLSPDVGHELPGCNFAIRRTTAEEAGGFDPTLDRIGKSLVAGGDFELGMRLVAAGRRTVYHPQCSIQHVIVPEKLTKTYLRRRFFGSGVTGRRTAPCRLTWSRKVRMTLGALRFGLRSLGDRILRRDVTAFEWELRMLEALGYLKG